MGKAKNAIRKKRCGRSKRRERANVIEHVADSKTMVTYGKFYEKIKEQEKIKKELKQKEKIEKRSLWQSN